MTPAGEDLLTVGAAVRDLTGLITDPALPGLGAWDVGGLAGHLLRAFRTPRAYLEAAAARQVDLPDAAAYIVAYLSHRDLDPARVDRSVASRGSAELGPRDTDGIAGAYQEALRDLAAALRATSASFVVASPFGGIERDEYLDTRILEATVHGIDLARAVGALQWSPPEAALRRSLGVLTEVAVRRGRANDLLMALTGRIDDPPTLLQ